MYMEKSRKRIMGPLIRKDPAIRMLGGFLIQIPETKKNHRTSHTYTHTQRKETTSDR